MLRYFGITSMYSLPTTGFSYSLTIQHELGYMIIKRIPLFAGALEKFNSETVEAEDAEIIGKLP